MRTFEFCIENTFALLHNSFPITWMVIGIPIRNIPCFNLLHRVAKQCIKRVLRVIPCFMRYPIKISSCDSAQLPHKLAPSIDFSFAALYTGIL